LWGASSQLGDLRRDTALRCLPLYFLERVVVLRATRRHANWARASALAILTMSIVYALMLPSDAMSRMSTDAFGYLAGAYSILTSGTYLGLSGAPQSTWPPGTSILYAAVARLGARPPEESVTFVNLAALLLMAGSLWVIIEITIERWWIAVITFASIVLSTAILSMQNKLWSDPLALATSSAALASGIVACRGGKNWYGWICAASFFLSIALCIRYAMLPGIPILAAVAFWLSKRTASHREAVFLPLLLPPLMTLISFFLVGFSSVYPHTAAVSSIATIVGSFDFRPHWPEFLELANQVIPVILLTTWLSLTVITVFLIVVPAGAAFIARMPQRSALLICVGYVLLSCVFLEIVGSSKRVDYELPLRYLLQIYPFMLIGAAIAADLLLNGRRLDARILGLVIVGLLSTAAVRSTRAVALGLLSHESQQSASCVSRTSLLDELKRIPITQSPSAVLSNIRGLVWYATRIPTVALTWDTLAHTPSGTTIIFARPQYVCPDVLAYDSVSEITLAPDVIVSSSGALLIGRKQ
jgi:hypothetical protein